VSQKVIAVLVIALTTAACVLGALWGVRFVNSAAPPPIIKIRESARHLLCANGAQR
jgi:hypothetical protein